MTKYITKYGTKNGKKEFCRSMSLDLPLLISEGLEAASVRYNVRKTDIVRSVLYDFLVSSGVLAHDKSLDRIEDEFVECKGRPSILLRLE